VSVSVRVNDIPSSDWSAVEGSTVSLECSTAIANPPVLPESTWWLKDGVVVQDGRRALVMQSLDRTHAGRYTCSATNTLQPSGEAPRNVTGTATVQLRVMCTLNHRLLNITCYKSSSLSLMNSILFISEKLYFHADIVIRPMLFDVFVLYPGKQKLDRFGRNLADGNGSL